MDEGRLLYKILQGIVMLKPMGNRVMVEVDWSDKVSSGGLILVRSESDKRASQVGKIVAVSDEVVVDLVEGDEIVFNQYSGDTIEDDGKVYQVIDVSDILVKKV